jgi:TP901 family phage tail tape measure protein
MDRVSDVLTAAFTRTNTDLRSLGDTMKYAGPVASKLGISLEEAPGWRVFWLTTASR